MQQRRSGTQIIVAGIGIIVLVLGVGLFFMNRGGSSSSAKGSGTLAANSQIVVALQAIPQGTTFQAGQPLSTFFAERKVPNNLVPFGAYTYVSQLNSLLRSTSCQPVNAPGCRGTVTTTQTIYQNLPVVSGMFSTLGQFRTQAGPAFQVPYGYVAQGISLTDQNSVYTSIQPGDDIDIMASLVATEGKGTTPKQTQYTLSDVRVIGVGPISTAPAPIIGSKTTGSTSPSTTAPSTTNTGGNLIVLVRYQQALILQHLKDFGGSWTMSAVLRSSKETDIPHFRTLPVFSTWFFTKQENRFDYSPPY